MEELNLYPYHAKLPFPQKVGKYQVETKKGCLIAIEGRKATHRALIDISPFPGFSPYSLEESIETFKRALKRGTSPATQIINPHVEFALFQLHQQQGRDSSQILTSHPQSNRLIGPTQLESGGDLAGTIKTKLRPENSDLILKAIAKNPQARWRLDGNAHFKTKEFLELEKKLLPFQERIDYVEEPLMDYQDYDQVQLPYAHEEHLQHYLQERSAACAVVLKPSQFGLKNLNNNDIPVRIILSSAFETPPALNALYYLAQKSAPETHGLGAFLSFEQLQWN